MVQKTRLALESVRLSTRPVMADTAYPHAAPSTASAPSVKKASWLGRRATTTPTMPSTIATQWAARTFSPSTTVDSAVISNGAMKNSV
ncbi:hypothetical protein D3C72_1436660 [compost metagenome]